MAGDDAPANSSKADSKLDDLLSLVLARTRGEVGNDDVEQALSSIVAAHAPPPPGKASTPKSNPDSAPNQKTDTIIADEGNYDDSDEEVDANASMDAKLPQLPSKKAATQQRSTRKRKNCPKREEALEKIPLGKMGERMLITFGDGPLPDLEVISSTLLGTRASLQRAILDARALRRGLQDKWYRARAVATMHRASQSNDQIKKTSTKIHASAEDNELSFKALDGYADSIRLDVPCGFDVPQLEVLFPEEMGAYQRWKKVCFLTKEICLFKGYMLTSHN